MITIAKFNHSRFEHPLLTRVIYSGEYMVISPEFEKSKAFKEGLARGKFTIIDVTDMGQVRDAYGVTDEILSHFYELLNVQPEESEDISEETAPEPVEAVETVTEVPVAEEKTEEEIVEEVIEETIKEATVEADVEEEEQPEVLEEEPAPVEKPELPDIDSMKYRQLQIYAEELEKATGAEINRSASTDALKAEIRQVWAKHNMN